MLAGVKAHAHLVGNMKEGSTSSSSEFPAPPGNLAENGARTEEENNWFSKGLILNLMFISRSHGRHFTLDTDSQTAKVHYQIPSVGWIGTLDSRKLFKDFLSCVHEGHPPKQNVLLGNFWCILLAI
jgi:hypothetical protein